MLAVHTGKLLAASHSETPHMHSGALSRRRGLHATVGKTSRAGGWRLRVASEGAGTTERLVGSHLAVCREGLGARPAETQRSHRAYIQFKFMAKKRKSKERVTITSTAEGATCERKSSCPEPRHPFSGKKRCMSELRSQSCALLLSALCFQLCPGNEAPSGSLCCVETPGQSLVHLVAPLRTGFSQELWLGNSE